MEHETDNIHVIPLSDQWEIEEQSGQPLAHDIDKDHAVETARKLAREQGVSTVILHDGDGVTEEISVRPAP